MGSDAGWKVGGGGIYNSKQEGGMVAAGRKSTRRRLAHLRPCWPVNTLRKELPESRPLFVAFAGPVWKTDIHGNNILQSKQRSCQDDSMAPRAVVSYIQMISVLLCCVFPICSTNPVSESSLDPDELTSFFTILNICLALFSHYETT